MAGRKFGGGDDKPAAPITDDSTFLAQALAELKLANGFDELSNYATTNAAAAEDIAWLDGRAAEHWGQIVELIGARRAAELAGERPRVVASAGPERKAATGS